MNPEIKAIVFDAYGTLLDINSLDDILEEHFGEVAGQVSKLWRKKQLEYTWLRTLMKRYQLFSEVTMDALTYSCRSYGLELDEVIRDRLYTEYQRLRAYPGTHHVLVELSGQIELGVLSNADHLMLQGAMERNNFQNLFLHILSTEDISLFKPDPEVYQLACDRFNTSPDQLLFVSGNPWDVSGAKSFGLKVAWLNRTGTLPEELGFKPDYELNRLEELVNLF